jgi:ABC-type amino acid transport substrate-binding protein
MAGTYDVVLGGMAVTDARRAEVDFTQSYHATDDIEWYIGRPGAPDPDRAMIAVQSGTVHHARLRASDRRFASFSTEAGALAALSEGSADLAFGPYENRADLLFLMSEQGFEFLYSESLPDDGVAMAVCKGNTALLANLNAAIETLRADGTLIALETRWFN